MRLFDENDVWLLALFSDLAMIALRNAELHSQIKELNQDLENKVAERTRLLTLAKEELAVKAEQLRTALAKTIHIQEEERARIPREMHDGVIQLITALRYELKAARVTWSNDQPEEALENLSQARELLDEMEQELRHVIYDLHPPALDAVDLVPALQKYTKNFEAISGIACDFRVTGTTYRLPSPLEVAIFRIVEQGLQNVAAHAGASETQIGLDFVQTGVELEIQDNGRGFEYSEIQLTNHNHLGLVSMRERVRNLNGSMDVHSKPGASTRLVFFFPTERGTNPDVLPSGILEYIAPSASTPFYSHYGSRDVTAVFLTNPRIALLNMEIFSTILDVTGQDGRNRNERDSSFDRRRSPDDSSWTCQTCSQRMPTSRLWAPRVMGSQPCGWQISRTRM